jgi:branched-chain amino acid transport system permease protein
MEGLLHQIVAGLVSGGTYALLALALVMIYQATHHVNFAQGEMATFSTFVAWALIQYGLPYWIAFLAAVVISFAAGAIVQVVVMRPFEKAPALNNLIIFLALLLIFHALSGWLFGHEIKVFPTPFSENTWYSSKIFPAHSVGSIALTAVVVAALFLFLRYTSVGLAMRAAALNPASARWVGIPVSWMLALGWGLAASIGAVAGMMIAPIVFLDPNMMSGVLLYAFASALLGGIDNPWGAAVGGFTVGIVENLLGAYVIGTDLKLTVALVLIVGILTLKPNGLFGKVVVERV